MNVKKIFYIIVLFAPVFFNPLRVTAQGCVPAPTGQPALAEGLITGKSLTNDVYTNGNCLIGSNSAIYLEQAKIKFDSYDDLKGLYYDQAKSTYKYSGNPVSPAFNLPVVSSNQLFTTSSDLNVGPYTYSAATGVAVVFVENNLNITDNIKSTGNTNGLVFVVRNNINITQNVREIDAVLIAGGDICTAYDSTLGICPSPYVTASDLTVKGSLISINTDTNSNHIKFVRTLADNSKAAEIVNTESKYLVILKDLLATDLLVVSQK